MLILRGGGVSLPPRYLYNRLVATGSLKWRKNAVFPSNCVFCNYLSCSYFAQKRSAFVHISPLFSSDAGHRTPKGDSSGPNPPAFLTRNRWTKCSVQIVLSNFGCGFLSHASAFFFARCAASNSKIASPDPKIHYPKFNQLLVQNTKFLQKALSAEEIPVFAPLPPSQRVYS